MRMVMICLVDYGIRKASLYRTEENVLTEINKSYEKNNVYVFFTTTTWKSLRL